MADSVLQGQGWGRGWGRGSPWRLPGSWRGRGRGKPLCCVQAVGGCWGGRGGALHPSPRPIRTALCRHHPRAHSPKVACCTPSLQPCSPVLCFGLHPASCTCVLHPQLVPTSRIPPSPCCVLHPQLDPTVPSPVPWSPSCTPSLHPTPPACTPSFPLPPPTLQTAPRRGGSPQHPPPPPPPPTPCTVHCSPGSTWGPLSPRSSPVPQAAKGTGGTCRALSLCS